MNDKVWGLGVGGGGEACGEVRSFTWGWHVMHNLLYLNNVALYN